MVEDVKAAEHIFGPETGYLTGMTVKRTGIAVRTNLTNLPFEILERYWSVTLSGDIMWINGIRFFFTKSRPVRFITSQAVRNATALSLGGYINKVVGVYMTRGFRIVEMQMDGQFEPLQGALAEMKITLNACSEAEHVGDIKRLNRTVKERARGVVTHLPYKKLPGRMVIELVHLCAFWLNVFPPGLKNSPYNES